MDQGPLRFSEPRHAATVSAKHPLHFQATYDFDDHDESWANDAQGRCQLFRNIYILFWIFLLYFSYVSLNFGPKRPLSSIRRQSPSLDASPERAIR